MTGRNDHQERRAPLPGVAAELDGVARDGLSWSWEVDVEALLAAVTGPAPWTCGLAGVSGEGGAASPSPAVASEPNDADVAVDPADAELAEYLEAVEAGRSQVVPLPVVAGRVAETLPTGPGLAGWLGAGEPGGLEDGALAGIAASYRRLASWAQAGELAVVAELASRSAAADDRAGVEEDGRPVKVPVDACAEVSLALTMSQSAATWWADLAVTLRWRLAATGAALAAGEIDLARARAIAEATVWLEEEKARAVQDRVLPRAGSQTTAQLRAALRRAVIAADPEGADRRREEAERQAKVMLYPDADGTASLGGYSLPGIPATAAMARISALARALQASGAGGGIDLLRAHVFVGLLLGTLPYIPPAAGAPPDHPPDDELPDDGSPDDGPPDDELPGRGRPKDGRPGDGPGNGGPPGGSLAEDEPPGDDPEDGDLSGAAQSGADQSGSGNAGGRAPADCPGSDDHRSRRSDHVGRSPGRGSSRRDRVRASANHGCRHNDQDSQPASHGRPSDPGNHPEGSRPERSRPEGNVGQLGEGDDLPGKRRELRRDRDEPRPGRGSPPGPDPGYGRLNNRWEAGGADDDRGWARPPPAWPQVPAHLQPGPAAMGHLPPAAGAGGLLDLRLDWGTLTGESSRPGYLGRLGPITAAQARHLAGLAFADPGTRWQIILTGPGGQAVATTRLVRRAAGGQPGLVKQVTVTIGVDCLTGTRPEGLPPRLDRLWHIARTLADHAERRAAADAQADGGCAHADATPAYQPTTALRDYITARDQTCRFPTCRQPIWRCDLDHTTPFDQGGRTCSCNLGGLCRFHHQIKGLARWYLDQATPGVFTWTTPTGRRYAAGPDSHAA